ncbi:uncharacterized protein LOC120428222 [Culex pipiens pallens]|uniref:uncharacterized protein LOC120428222 n=1 Tax=Culex pipiens pallens TaxID=42434 RepID=UPI001954BAB1|nr:uncharacterized protein LOC120428222 [Culex pipiens pallens]
MCSRMELFASLLVIASAVVLITPEVLHRPERSVLNFPSGTSNGFLIAIAIPLEVPGRNIYLSHNFEMNYGLPTAAYQYRLWYTLFKNSGYNVTQAVNRKRRMVENVRFSRRFLYEMLADRMDMYGYNGTACIHRAICETLESSLHPYNGVVGDVTHIVFSPSASEDEDIPVSYYQAEADGCVADCEGYRKYCPVGIFDLISTVINA